MKTGVPDEKGRYDERVPDRLFDPVVLEGGNLTRK
jgi:hypothetical protein